MRTRVGKLEARIGVHVQTGTGLAGMQRKLQVGNQDILVLKQRPERVTKRIRGGQQVAEQVELAVVVVTPHCQAEIGIIGQAERRLQQRIQLLQTDKAIRTADGIRIDLRSFKNGLDVDPVLDRDFQQLRQHPGRE